MASILVVDDRAINREFLVMLLGYAGHDVREAADGRQALEIAREIKPDLVITDILMPTMDGVEFTQRLAKDRQLCCIPVIFYTATYRVGEARALAAKCGVTTVIAKPSDPQVVLDAVHGELGLGGYSIASEQIATLTGRHAALSIDRLCVGSVEEIASLQARMKTAVELDDSPSNKARQINHISTQLDASLTRAQALSMRLAALVELGVDLASQREPVPMLEMFCRASRDIMNAKIAAVCMLREDGGITEFASWGMTAAQASAVRATLVPTGGVFAAAMHGAGAQRHENLRGQHEAIGFPEPHPPIENVLVLPVVSLSRTHGWFYVADRLGTAPFSEDDAQLGQTLVAQLVPAYENLLLYDSVSRQAAVLAIEIDERKEALDRLRTSETRFRQLAENIREVFFLVEIETGAMLYVSPTYEEIWERSTDSLYANPQSWLDAVHPDDYDTVRQHFVQERSGGFRLKYRIQCRSGTRWIKAQSFPVYDANGKVCRIAGLAEDITESELQERRISRLSRIQGVLSGINSAIVRVRERSALLDEACRIAKVHGLFPLAWIGLVQPSTARIEFVACDGDDPAAASALSAALVDASLTKRGLGYEAQRDRAHAICNDIERASQHDRVLRLALDHGYRSAIALPLMPDGKPAGAIVLFSKESDYFDDQELRLLDELAGDVSFALEYIARVERLNYLAYYDALTDLPNMTLFQEQIAIAIEHEPETNIALLLLDLDRFTHLNDTLGRHVGDQILIAVGKRLKTKVARHGRIARVSSDTFAAAVTSLHDETEARASLQALVLDALNEPFIVDGSPLRISARIGVATYPADGNDHETLFTNAEAALKEAKATGLRCLFYSPQLNARVAEQLALEQKLHGAIENNEFILHYQPKVQSQSGRVVGFEALLRWNSPDDGLVSPANFIPVLESSQMILEVGQWALDRALADHKTWVEQGLRPPRMAVNVSPLQLRYDDFPAMVLETLERHRSSGSALELEITETVIMNNVESTIIRLQTLAERAIAIAVDDFGTGYSSLRYLAKLPVHALKIDRSFIVTMTADADSMTLVSSIISLAHLLGLQVVAEGVESEEQAKFLRLMKCDVMQGYLFGRPQPAADIVRLLEREMERD